MSDLIEKISSQQSIAEQIRSLQAQERKLRAEILLECFGESNIGSIKTQVSNLIITGEYGLTYKFDQQGIDNALEVGDLSAEAMKAIRVKYELDKKAYDMLDSEAQEELDQYLTVTPSLPTIKVKTIVE